MEVKGLEGEGGAASPEALHKALREALKANLTRSEEQRSNPRYDGHATRARS